MIPETNIDKILEGEIFRVYLTLKTADGIADTADFDVYGGATDGRNKHAFTVSTTGAPGQFLVAIPGLKIQRSLFFRYQVCARRRSDGCEWEVLQGKITLKPRVADTLDTKLFPQRLDAETTLAADTLAVTVENMGGPRGEQGQKGETGPRGYSAYEIALENGFVGSETEWLESLKADAAQAATEAVREYVSIAEQAARNAINAQILAEAAAMNALENK